MFYWVEVQVPIRTLQRDTSEILRRERYQRNIERTTRRMKPYSPTSRDTVYNLDTASNPSSPPHFTNDIPSTVLQVRARSNTKKIRHCLDEDTATSSNMVRNLIMIVRIHMVSSDHTEKEVHIFLQ